MSNILYYKDESLSYVFNYKTVPVKENSKDTGFIIRTIELYRLAKLGNKIKQFSELTGFHFDNLIPTAEEMKLLIKQGANIVSSYSKLTESEQAELQSRIEQMTSIQDGRAHKPANYPNARAWAQDMHRSVELQEHRVKNENDKFNKVSGIYGLLKPIIEWMLSEKVSGVKKGLLDSLPNQQVNLNFLLSNMNWSHEQPCKFITDSMDEFESCLDDVIRNCTPSKDIYVLNNTPTYRIEYYKHYYSNKEPHLKEILTAKEYADSMVHAESKLQQKLKYM